MERLTDWAAALALVILFMLAYALEIQFWYYLTESIELDIDVWGPYLESLETPTG